MSFHVPQLKYALGLGGIMSFYGMVSVIVWLIPSDQFGGKTNQIVTVALILVTMPFVLLFGYIASRRQKKREEKKKAEKEAQVEEKADVPQLSKVAAPDDISKAAEETVQFLKTSNLGSGKDAVYELPWYLVIGGPKSGKTSLSLASGLNFQTLPSQRQSELKFIRPTRNVDWRVTSEAVFLDTAGRYQLEGGDEDEWAGLVDTIRKYRPNRPLDGMIVSVNVERILHGEDHEIEQIAKVLRARIDEVTTRTRIRFPIYLVFTHADSIEGFRDSFSSSQKEGQNLGWGATIPLEKSENAHTLFDAEFDLLHTSVMKRRLMRLSAPFQPIRQLKIFNFPAHFGSARKKLGHFVTNLFRPNPFSQNPFLRGFYFTAVPVNRGKVDGGQTVTNVGQTVGSSYFTERLYRDVILRDKDLVATFQAQKVRPPIMGWLLTFLGAILTFFLLTGAGISLYLNKKLVDEAKDSGEAVLTMVRGYRNRSPLQKNASETADEINKIEALRESLAKLDKSEKEWQPLMKWFGLYSGNRIYHEKLLPIYYSAIEQRYKQPMLQKIEADLRNFSSGNAPANTNDPAQLVVLDKNFELFRAYLMLSNEQINSNLKELGSYRDYAESNSMFETLNPYLSEAKISEDSIEKAKEQLKFYFQQRARQDFPSTKLDVTLVEATRKKLENYPPWAKYYKTVTDKISREIPSIDADKMLAGKGGDQGVLTSSHTVKGVYTILGYKKMQEAIDAAAVPGNLNKDDWVMGGNSKKDADNPAAVAEIKKKYFSDYISNWKKFINGITVKSYNNNKDEAVKALTAFSDVNSPLKTLLEGVSQQTNLSADPPEQSLFDTIWNYFKPKPKQKKDPTPVETEFDALFKFTESKEGAASQLTNYGNALGRLLRTTDPDADITKLEQSQLSIQIQDPKSPFSKLFSGVQKETESLIGNLKNGSTADVGNLLRRPLSNLSELVGGGIKDQINKEWGEVFAKSKAAEKGYPFDNNGGDAEFKALTEYLAPGGTLEKFYNTRLKKYFDGEAPNLKPKENTDGIKFTDEFVKYLNDAFRLRDALFGKNPTISFSYGLRLKKESADTTIEMTIDGQVIDTTKTGSINLTFPAASGTTTGAFLKSSGATEAPLAPKTPTPTPLPLANSNSGNVNSNSVTPSATPTPKPASKPKPTPKVPDGSGDYSSSGDWGLFHFFDKGKPSSKNADGEYTLTYNIGGKNVTVFIKPPASGDLFERSIFTSVHAPQGILR